MSVVIFGVFIAQIVGLALLGLVLRLLPLPVAGSKGVVRPPMRGYWSERNLSFDGSLMHAGKNELVLTVPAGGLTSGVIYDYLRLELDENAAGK